jgi:type II secretory pathway pseudopilin PulG
MVGVVLLAVIALGGAAYFQHTRARLSLQTARREALELANGRLEALRATAYVSILPPTGSVTAYLAGGPDSWTQSPGDPGEVLHVDGRNYPIVTRVDAVDVDGVAPATDCLRLTVSVVCRTSTAERVTLGTIQFPMSGP